MGNVNQLICSQSLDAMTTAAVVAYYREKSKATISYAGHPPILFRRKGDKSWSYARQSGNKIRRDAIALNIPLAVEMDTRYEEFTISMDPGDRLFVYTDGIIDTPNPDGERFGLARLKSVLDENASIPLPKVKSAVLKSLNQYAQTDLFQDDVTLIALEIS